jgi:hypothetical protein
VDKFASQFKNAESVLAFGIGLSGFKSNESASNIPYGSVTRHAKRC